MSSADPSQPKKKNKALIIVSIIVGAILVLFAGCGILVNTVFNKASDAVANVDLGVLLVNPDANSQTGLTDGSYTMSKDSYVTNADACSIYGTVTEGAGTSVGTSVGLYVKGALCEGIDTKTSVAFTVTAGTAEINSIT